MQLVVFNKMGQIVWRTLTPMPIQGDIVLTYIKDVTRFIPLFSEPGTFVLQLDNVVQPGLDGEFASEFYLLLQFRQEYSEILLCSDSRSDVFRVFGTFPARTARRHDCSADDSR